MSIKKIFTFFSFMFLLYIFNVNIFNYKNLFQTNNAKAAEYNRRLKAKDMGEHAKVLPNVKYCLAVKASGEIKDDVIVYPKEGNLFITNGALLSSQVAAVAGRNQNSGETYILSEAWMGYAILFIIALFITPWIPTVTLPQLYPPISVTAWCGGVLIGLFLGALVMFSFYFTYSLRYFGEMFAQLDKKVSAGNVGVFLEMLLGLFGGANLENKNTLGQRAYNILMDVNLGTNTYCMNLGGLNKIGGSEPTDAGDLQIYKELPYLQGNVYNYIPIYPQTSVVTKGQCNIDKLVNEINNSSMFYPFASKCNVMVNNNSFSCIGNNIALMIINLGLTFAADVICASSNTLLGYAAKMNPWEITWLFFKTLFTTISLLFAPLGVDVLFQGDIYNLSEFLHLMLKFIVNAWSLMITAIKSVATASVEMPKAIGAIGVCIGAHLVGSLVLRAAIDATLRGIDTETQIRATKGIERIKFCGWNYYSYAGVSAKKDADLDKQIEDNKLDFDNIENKLDHIKNIDNKLLERYLSLENGAINTSITKNKAQNKLYYLTNTAENKNHNIIYEYFDLGSNPYSYSKCLTICRTNVDESTSTSDYFIRDSYDLNKTNTCIGCLKDLGYYDDEIVNMINNNYVISEENKITFFNTSNQNLMEREFKNDGKEYAAPLMLEDNDQEEAFINPKSACIDPRINSEKGYLGINQRYYMRGNVQANFACNRFGFYQNNGCVIAEEDLTIDSNHKSELSKKVFIEKVGNVKYYHLDKTTTNDSKILNIIDQYQQRCIQYMDSAMRCCLARELYFVCLEDPKSKKSFDREKLSTSVGQPQYDNLNYVNYTFCASEPEVDSNTLAANASQKKTLLTSIMDAANPPKEDEVNSNLYFEPKCKLPVYFEVLKALDYRNVKFNIFHKPEEGKGSDSRYACVFSDNNCPKNFRLNGGLNYPATYCDAPTLEYSTFGQTDDVLEDNVETDNWRKIEYQSSNQACISGIYNEINCLAEPDYLGNLKQKNLTQPDSYRYVKQSNQITLGYTFAMAAFDMRGYNDYDYNLVCPNGKCGTKESKAFGRVKNYCQFRAHCVKLASMKSNDTANLFSLFMDKSCSGTSSSSRNQFNAVGSKRIISTVIECLHETLQNVVNGVAGVTKCNNGYMVNKNGYCGDDTYQMAKNLFNTNKELFKKKYFAADGLPMDEEFNPFYKLQKNILTLAKTALTLFVAAWGLRKVLFGEYNLDDAKEIKKMIFTAVKFSIVCYFALGTAWQKGQMNKYLVDFATSSFVFGQRLLNKSLDNKHYQVLNGEQTFILTRVNEINKSIAKEDVIPFCAKIFDNPDKIDKNTNYMYKTVNEYGLCEEGYKIIGDTDVIDKTKINGLKIASNQGINTLIYFADGLNKYLDKNKLSQYNYYIAIQEGAFTEAVFITIINPPVKQDEPKIEEKEFDFFEVVEKRELFKDTDIIKAKDKNGKTREIKIKDLQYLGTILKNSHIKNYIIEKNGFQDVVFVKKKLVEDNYYNINSFNNKSNNTSETKKMIWNRDYDGCYFDEGEYEPDKTYLSIFDTLDCKITRYIGFSDTKSVPRIILFGIVVSYLGAIGPLLLTMVFAIILAIFNLALEVIYIFTFAFFRLGILVMVSPLIIPLLMFERTKSIFSNWLNKIIGTVLTPIFLIMSIMFYISVMDMIMYRDIKFTSFIPENGRVPIMDFNSTAELSKGADKYNFFYVLANPFETFHMITVGVVGGIFSVLGGATMTELLENSLVHYVLQLLLVYFLIKNADNFITNSQSFVDKLLGDLSSKGIRGHTDLAEGGKALMNKAKDYGKKANELAKSAKTIARRKTEEGIYKGVSSVLTDEQKEKFDKVKDGYLATTDEVEKFFSKDNQILGFASKSLDSLKNKISQGLSNSIENTRANHKAKKNKK